jgi:phage baseplate assembly protein gpV
MVITVGGVALTISGSGVAVTGGTITHDGTVIDKTHLHTGVVHGGDLTGAPP